MSNQIKVTIPIRYCYTYDRSRCLTFNAANVYLNMYKFVNDRVYE